LILSTVFYLKSLFVSKKKLILHQQNQLMNNCLLTGVTGIVGSHILFEWLQKALVSNTTDHLFLLVRHSKDSASKRIEKILTDSSRPKFMHAFTLKDCLERITIISNDISSLSSKELDQYRFSNVIHCAGSTNLMHSEETKHQVHEENYLVTQHLLTIIPKTVTRFLYISTAFSFGIQNNIVKEGMLNFTATKFRNPYEHSKYDSEVMVKQLCNKKNIQAQILRPSIVCGRLLEAPFFETPKFDVFYSWAIFLDKYAKKAEDTFRIWIDKTSGLNIVPVDFVAKAILYAYETPTLKELNIINPEKILHKSYVGDVLKKFNIQQFEYVSDKPENLNLFEQLYYKTIGSVFEKYISIPDLKFDTELISKLITDLNLETGLGVHQNFMKLIDFSVDKRFRKSYL